MSEHPEDVEEATAAALRAALEKAADTFANFHRSLGLHYQPIAAEAARLAEEATRGALAGDPGRTFLAHMRRLETENAVLREDVPRFLAENARIRGLLAHFENCPHGCQDAGFCPHYARVRKLGLLDPRPVQSSAPRAEPA